MILVHSGSLLFNTHQNNVSILFLIVPLCDSLSPPFMVLFHRPKNGVMIKKTGKSLLAPFLSLIEKSLHDINNAAAPRSGAARSNSKKPRQTISLDAALFVCKSQCDRVQMFHHVTQWTHKAPCWFGASDKLHQTVCSAIFFFSLPKRKQSVPASLAEELKINRCDWEQPLCSFAVISLNSTALLGFGRLIFLWLLLISV